MYLSLQTFLMGRVDDQLANGVDEAANALGATGPFPQRTPYFPVGTVVQLIASDGSVADGKVVAPFGTNGPTARPNLPRTLPNYGTDKPAPPYKAPAINALNSTNRKSESPLGRTAWPSPARPG